MSMSSESVLAVLFAPNGTVLLVQRKGAALLSLPGGRMVAGGDVLDTLASYCRRQTGCEAEWDLRLSRISIGGEKVTIASGKVAPMRVAARGAIDATFWADPHSLPLRTDPRVAIAIAVAQGPEDDHPATGSVEPIEAVAA